MKVRLVKGLRGTQSRHRLSVRALGLNKLNDVRELKDSPQVRGLINKVHYLVRVEEMRQREDLGDRLHGGRSQPRDGGHILTASAQRSVASASSAWM